MMKALVWTAPNEIELLELPIPEPRANEALVKVKWCGICGSEVESFLSARRRRPPLIMGHEFSGVVEAVGEGINDLSVGESVVINPLMPCGQCYFCLNGQSNICPKRKLISMHRPGGFAEYVCVPRRCLHKLPEGLPQRDAVLVEPLANVIHAFRRAGRFMVDVLVIIGAGTIGLLSLQVAKLIYNAKVIVVEPVEVRRRVALQLGADLAVSPKEDDVVKLVNEITEGKGASVCIDAVGKSEARALSCKVLSPNGVSLWVGLHEFDSSIDGVDIVTNEKNIIGSYAYTDDDFKASIRLLCAGRICTDGWVSETPLEDGKDIFMKLVSGAEGLIKVLLKC
jgi:threonine dehydrogenase-like Zn-dependent dehydrogenase